jgi:nucleoside-diphosphate-sugar epimerase
MKVFVAGATGAIGTQLVPQLAAGGHDVIAMTRSPAKTDALRALGARSGDRGATFSARERITARTFDMRSAPFAGGFFMGDYEGLDSAGRTFKPVFGVANTGNQANPTNMLATTVRLPIAGPAAAEATARVDAADARHTPGRLRTVAPTRRR